MATLIPENYSFDRVKKYAAHFSHDPSGALSADPVAAAVTDVTEAERLARQRKAAAVASDYYDFVTPLYEQGWGQRFHYAPLAPGLSIADSMTAYEKEFARIAGLERGMKVLDLGCGIGGPARTYAKLVSCHIVGITNNSWHIERGRALTREAGLEKLVSFVQGDYNNLPFADATFDAVYAMDALCYATDQPAIYKEISRVLKPQGLLAFADWVMTDKFDADNAEHRKVRNWIEFGNGITRMPERKEVQDALKAAKFEVFHEENMAYRSAPAPWYYGPAGNVRWAVDWEDFWKVFKMSPFFLFFVNNLYRLLVLLRIAPKELMMLMDTMWYCCRSVAIGGKLDIFTPLYLVAARKRSVEGEQAVGVKKV